MPSFDSVSLSDDYKTAATLSEIWKSNGGFFTVTSNDAFMSLQYGSLGQLFWTDDTHVPVGAAGTIVTLLPGTTGVRLKNYTAGNVAVASATLAREAEPSIVIAASGFATGTGSSKLITGQISGAGAIVAGSGFTVVKGGAGVYTINFTAAFAAAPDVLVTLGPGAGLAQLTAVVASTAPGSCVVNVFTTAGVGSNQPFMFTAQPFV